MTVNEIDFMGQVIAEIAANHEEWSKDYHYDSLTNEFEHRNQPDIKGEVEGIFRLGEKV